jgi:hypothetical protein
MTDYLHIADFAPMREATKVGDGWKVVITPPTITRLPSVVVDLTDDQYRRYLAWRDGGALIQMVLSDLSESQREMLMTGIGG